MVTFVVLVLELTATRLYAYIGSSHATSTALSIALLGLGVGAFVRARVPRGEPPRSLETIGIPRARALDGIIVLHAPRPGTDDLTPVHGGCSCEGMSSVWPERRSRLIV